MFMKFVAFFFFFLMIRRPPRSPPTDSLFPYTTLFRSVNVPLHQLTSADFQRSLDINVLGVFHCMKHQIAAMLKAGSGGSIVNTASVGGTVAIPAHGEYIAAKHAVIGLTRIAAVDYGQ